MITFDQWDITTTEYKVFTVYKDNLNVAKLLLDERAEYNSVLSFHSNVDYSARKLVEISHAIWAEFGDIEFRIGG